MEIFNATSNYGWKKIVCYILAPVLVVSYGVCSLGYNFSFKNVDSQYYMAANHSLRTLLEDRRPAKSFTALHELPPDDTAIQLDGDALQKLKLREIQLYGTHRVDLNSSNPLRQAPIPYLPNYKNPCWYQENRVNVSELKCLPYFLVVGVAKCGTTNMFNVLQLHHQIVPANFKEIFWWTKSSGKPGKSLQSYTKSFSRAALDISRYVTRNQSFHSHVTYDSTPGVYFKLPHKMKRLLHFAKSPHGSTHTNADDTKNFLQGPTHTNADDIKKLLPNAKIMVTLRDPTTRLYSDYNHFHHRSAMDFHKSVEASIRKWNNCVKASSERGCAYQLTRKNTPTALSLSMYDVFAADWLKVFPRDQIYFSKLEQHSQNKTQSLSNIFKFLDIEPMGPELMISLQLRKDNHRPYKIGPMMPATKKILDEFYKPHRKRLAELLKDDKWLWLETS